MTLQFHELNTETNTVDYLGKIDAGEIVDGHANLGFLKNCDITDEDQLRKQFAGPYVFASPTDTLTARITDKDTVAKASAQQTDWKPYEGPQGGQGWQHPQTGEVRYQQDPPDAEGGDADGDGRWTAPPEDSSEYRLGQRVAFESTSGTGEAVINDIMETQTGAMLELVTDEGEPFNYRTDGNNQWNLTVTGVADTDGPGGTDGFGGDDTDGGENVAEDTDGATDGADGATETETDSGGPDLPDVEVTTTTPETFVDGVELFMSENPELGAFLSKHDPAELEDHTLLSAADGLAGVSVSPEGDIQNLFSHPTDAPSGTGRVLIEKAIEQGGRTLDCYDGFLPDLYAEYGFRETGRIEFNPEYAPDDWNFDDYGQPDVVFMSYQPETEYTETEDYYQADEWDQAKQDSRRTADTGQGRGEKGRRVRRGTRGNDSRASPSRRRTLNPDAETETGAN